MNMYLTLINLKQLTDFDVINDKDSKSYMPHSLSILKNSMKYHKYEVQ